tara:strand:- start:411 stop:602 length:192 start_codon:yes stop_codon:yes gene_type:complete
MKLDTRFNIKYYDDNGISHKVEATLDELINRTFNGAYIDFPHNSVYLFDCYNVEKITKIKEKK